MEMKIGMAETLAISVVLLMLGRWIKSKSPVLQKFFIPAPVVSGLIFSIFILIGRQTGAFSIAFDLTLQNFLMIAFFTTVGFMASLKLLAQGGIGVAIFLAVATVLVICQDIIGVGLAQVMGQHPLFGLVVGSVPLTGGHGTAGAFGKTIVDLGVPGADTAGIAAATFGLVMGCLIGGPVARRLMIKHNLKCEENEVETKELNEEDSAISEDKILYAVVAISVAMGIGAYIPPFVKEHTQWLMKGGLSLPAYIGPMLIAALMRNICDSIKKPLPMKEIDVVGNISLSIFLSMALMTMKLWELTALAIPMIVILAIQTIFVMLYTYFVTYNVMRLPFIATKYDAAVMAAGHCGFGLGATPTAIANMEAFTSVNGFSTKAFFIVPLVGALFIDFTNAAVITIFINMFS